jgi:hypothetical protein
MRRAHILMVHFRLSSHMHWAHIPRVNHARAITMNIQNITSNPDIQAMRNELAQIDARLIETRSATDIETLIERDTLFIRWGKAKGAYDIALRNAMKVA